MSQYNLTELVACLFEFFVVIILVMKNLLIFAILIQYSFANASNRIALNLPIDQIPHYKIYPQTPIMDYQGPILDFYSVKNLYGEFSNFALFPIELDGLIWPSSEHYYQAQKFLDPNLKEKVRAAKSPFDAATIGRDPSLPSRADWDQIKDEVMEKALHAKFAQYEILQKLLISTNHAAIFEHTKNDCYWADCLDRSGLDKLGHMLEVIRSEYQTNE